MRKFFFEIVSVSTYGLITLSDHFHDFVVGLISFTNQSIKWIVAHFGGNAMKIIDPKSYEEIQQRLEARDSQIELELLNNVSLLKEDALEKGEWSEQHTEALQAIGNALVGQCNWQEHHVHQYMKGVVESIPGLAYSTDDSEDEDDDEPLDLLQ